ncbi:MAG: TetR family transcriptional regulator [Carbonactinosporaceae bacterium]
MRAGKRKRERRRRACQPPSVGLPVRRRRWSLVGEDLFYARFESFGARLVDAISTRPAGESGLAAFRRYLLASQGLPAGVERGDREALARLRTVNRVISASPALLTREQQAFARYTDSLVEVLAVETGAPPDDLSARVAANALMGVHRALIDYARNRVLADEAVDRLASDVRSAGERAFELLEAGLGDYGRRVERVSVSREP